MLSLKYTPDAIYCCSHEQINDLYQVYSFAFESLRQEGSADGMEALTARL